MGAPNTLILFGPVRFVGVASNTPPPGVKPLELLIRVLLDGEEQSRAELARRLWPKSDITSRNVLLFNARSKWRDWAGGDNQTGPIIIDSDRIAFNTRLVNVDLQRALEAEAKAAAPDASDQSVIAAVAEFVEIAGDRVLCVDGPVAWDGLRLRFEARRVETLEIGLCAARRVGRHDLVSQWEPLHAVCRARVLPAGSATVPVEPDSTFSDDSGQATPTLSDDSGQATSTPSGPYPSSSDGPRPNQTVIGDGADRPARERPSFPAFAAIAGGLGLAAWVVGGWLARSTPDNLSAQTRPPRTVGVRYVHPEIAGEEDSEATDVSPLPGSIGGWVATGLVQTQDNDVDILTIRIGRDGKALWSRRWSGPGRDCDRAFSVVARPDGGAFVAGETYVPAGAVPGCTEGWHLLVLDYDSEGRLRGAARSRARVRNPDHAVKLGLDSAGSLWVAGTSIEGGNPRFLALRWGSGEPPREWTVGSRPGELTSMSVANSGKVFLFGTQRNPNGMENSRDWAALCLDPLGRMLWERRLDGDAKGDDVSCEGMMDAFGRIRVYGPLSSRLESGGKAVLPTVATLDAETGSLVTVRRQPDVLGSPLLHFTSATGIGWDILALQEAVGSREIRLRVTGIESGNPVMESNLGVPDGEQILGVVGLSVAEQQGRNGVWVDAAVANRNDRVPRRMVSWWVPESGSGRRKTSGVAVGDDGVLVRRSYGDVVVGQTVPAAGKRRFFLWQLSNR